LGQTRHAYSLRPGKYFIKVKTPKGCPQLSPTKGATCTLETKHDRRTAPRTKLFFSAKRLQEQRQQPQITVFLTSPGEDDFFSSEIRHDTRIGPIPKLLVSAQRIQEKRHNLEKVPWLLELEKVLSLPRQLSTIKLGTGRGASRNSELSLFLYRKNRLT
jgi:hypothetical protein